VHSECQYHRTQNIDRSWIKAQYISDDYQKGVEDFLQFAQQNALELVVNYFCPCVKCINGRLQSLNDIRSHLISEWFSMTYTNWIWHGELPHMSTAPHTEAVDVQTEDRMEDMIRDPGQEGFRQAHPPYYEKLQNRFQAAIVFGMHNLHSIIGGTSFGELEGQIWVE